MGLIKKLRKAKSEALPNEKPPLVKTHLRDMVILPEMVGSVIGVYSGKTFNQVEIKPEMIGMYLAEFSISYKPVKHGRPGIGATHSSRFVSGPGCERLFACTDSTRFPSSRGRFHDGLGFLDTTASMSSGLLQII